MKTLSLHLPSSRLRSGAFTLLEILIVVAVLAILATLLFPALQSAQERAKSAGCLANLRQLHIAIMALANEDDGQLPLSTDTNNSNSSLGCYLIEGGYLPPLPPLVSGKRSRKHPLFDPGSSMTIPEYSAGSYGINGDLTGSWKSTVRTRMVTISHPQKKFLLFCSGLYFISRLQAANPSPPYLYLPGRSANRSLGWSDTSRRDAIEGRHGRKINTITLAGNAEVWNADEIPLTSDHWDK